MPMLTDAVRAALPAFLLVTGGLLLLLVVHIVVLHAVGEVGFRRRQRLLARYRPLVDRALDGDADATRTLTAVPRRHRAVVAALLLDPLRVATGRTATHALSAADALGLVSRWKAQLGDRRWWVRADAARALGLVRCGDVVAPLVLALDDPYDDVRAAAVESLGSIADPQTVPELVARLPDQSRHQRVRLVHALQQFGVAAVPPLIAHGDQNPAQRAAVAEILGSIGAAAALDRLVAWSSDGHVDVRAAVWQAVGTIGVDDRAYYHLLRALNDPSDVVRAAAAWALGRSGRQDGAAYLATRLDDEWIVAAQSARALRALGDAGRRELERAATGSELARQMLWESRAAAAV
jgi:hypothetical protein